MDTDEFDTPQKTKPFTPLTNLLPKAMKCNGVASPNRMNRKSLHPRTPSGSQTRGNCSSLHIFPNQMINSPPAKRFHKVRNPFEAALAERLHLPLIASPSLFQRPTTPQFSSTQFEWTIEDVSSLKPAHLEPHETQFQDSPDPDYEAKAQSAISSYFKEHQIVPSPVDCPLRNHRILLSAMNGNTPIAKPGRRIRDCSTQTALSLPPVLPQALEEALKPYLQPHFTDVSDNESTPIDRGLHRNMTMESTDFKDISLRRKLFDMHNIVVLDNENRMPAVAAHASRQSNSSPASVGSLQHTAIVGKLSDSIDKSSFGSLSPISASDSLSISAYSPQSAKRKSRRQNFLDFCETETLSPIHPPTQMANRKTKKFRNVKISNDEIYRMSANASAAHNFGDVSICDESNRSEQFTPDGSSSPLHCLETAELSNDNSFNMKVGRLAMNSCSKLLSGKNTLKSNVVDELHQHDETADMFDVEDEEMQVSQLSLHSSISNSSNSDTPRGKRRSASRKNLSRSFSTNWHGVDGSDDQDPEAEQSSKALSNSIIVVDTEENVSTEKTKMLSSDTAIKNDSSEQRLLFYRTDSGFNEMTSSQNAQQDEQVLSEIRSLEPSISLVCCSTPSKQRRDDF